MANEINYICFPRTEPPPSYAEDIISVFEQHLTEIGTLDQDDGLRSDEVLGTLRPALKTIGFDVEEGKKTRREN